jgi:hypothetical protein
LSHAGTITSEHLQVILRASGQRERYAHQLEALGIEDIVHLEPAIPYREALEEMMQADGLLLFQGSNCNRQIPAKAYEYMRANRPIFVLADPDGDTATLMRYHGIDSMAPLDCRRTIAERLPVFLKQLDQREAPLPDQDQVIRYSRAQLTGELARLFDSISD